MQATSTYTPVGIHVASLPVVQVIPIFFFLVFFIWAVYTLVAIYHWLRYSDNLTVSLSAISVHLIVSAWIAIFAVSGVSGIH